jgi:hypothetical protein
MSPRRSNRHRECDWYTRKRQLVLYSIRRGTSAGGVDTLLARHIKNLAGRAGRALAQPPGLVVCINDEQWPAVERIAMEQPGEDIHLL